MCYDHPKNNITVNGKFKVHYLPNIWPNIWTNINAQICIKELCIKLWLHHIYCNTIFALRSAKPLFINPNKCGINFDLAEVFILKIAVDGRQSVGKTPIDYVMVSNYET